MDRGRRRQLDMDESYYLLLELCCNEPIIQQCFNVLENICLAHGISMTGKKPTPRFQRHIDMHYVPFLRGAIRAMHMYGFVPWRVMTLDSGDKIPEILPPGSFRWTIEPPSKEKKDTYFTSKFKDAMLCYVVRLNAGAKQEEHVHITQWTPPNSNVCERSVMYATVPSPISYVIESYKQMQSALQRQSHADAWNCTARVIVSNEPKEFAHDQHRREIFTTFHQHLDQFGKLNPHKPSTTEDKVGELFEDHSQNHTPSVYTLPAHHHIDNAPQLQPCVDITYLQSKYKNDVCSLIGVPPELISSVQDKGEGPKQSAAASSSGMNRIFQAKMQAICFYLKTLLAEVYSTIYKDENVEFDITPMPRLEITCMEDLRILHEIGVLQPEHTVDLASVLLGKLKKAKHSPTQAFEQNSTAGASQKSGAESRRP